MIVFFIYSFNSFNFYTLLASKVTLLIYPGLLPALLTYMYIYVCVSEAELKWPSMGPPSFLQEGTTLFHVCEGSSKVRTMQYFLYTSIILV